jgi:hypothetical protein
VLADAGDPIVPGNNAAVRVEYNDPDIQRVKNVSNC